MPLLKLPLGQEVEYRGMTGREEDILTNRKKVMSGEALDEVLANCTLRIGENKNVQIGDVQRLKGPDRAALLIAIRRESFGDELTADLKCDECREMFGVSVDLSQLPDRPAPEGEAPYTIEVEVDGKPVKLMVDFIDGRAENALAKVKDNVATMAMLYAIKEIEGVHSNDKKRWLLDLPIRARNEIRDKLKILECGPDPVATADCPNCGNEVTFNVQSQPGFFFPRT